MSITHNLKTEVYQQETSVAVIVLLDIDYGGEEDIHIARNHEPVESAGVIYEPLAFDVELHSDRPDAPGSARLVIDNIDRRLITAVRSATEIFITLKLVSTLDLDVAELEERYKLKSVGYTAQRVSGDLVLDDYLWDRWPNGQYTPRHFRGIV